jgi:hypothetical protein
LFDSILDIFVADISYCYKTIFLQGLDNLFEAISFVSSMAFKQVGLAHPRATTTTTKPGINGQC